MRILCLGGGPAGLYFAILMKRACPECDIQLYERHRADDTYGWGVVFSDQAQDLLGAADPETRARIAPHLHHWDDCIVHIHGERIVCGGHGFAGISRHRLLAILQQQARELGVALHFEHEIRDPGQLANHSDYDLIVGADGINSSLRQCYASHFQPSLERRHCRFIWLALRRRLAAFTFISEPSPWGWFQVHAYPFDEFTSTFIVECHEETWLAAGLDKFNIHETLDFCERLFAGHLAGARLMSNNEHSRGTRWLNFNRLSCTRWVHEHRVLLGDAGHSVHFSIGSGTRLAMEGAISLSQEILRHPGDLAAALKAYETGQQLAVRKLANAARNRMEWFENLTRHTRLEPVQFAYSLLTSSQRLGHASLRLRDPAYIEQVEQWLASQSHDRDEHRPGKAPPPMFTSYKLRELPLANRVVVAPMAIYAANAGVPGEFHRLHLGARALGGAALVMTEMTAPLADGRISTGCPGLWNDEQQQAWRHIVDLVHDQSPARIGLQLGHAGPKGAVVSGLEHGNTPLPPTQAWPLIAASAQAYSPQLTTPRAMTRADMRHVLAAFVAATERAAASGFDLLELHCAHGYLLSSFICPLSNRRDDEYGGPLENRLRFPLEVCQAMRHVWPQERPMAVRISAHDWAPGGNTDSEAVIMARMFRDLGVDLIDVSSGMTTPQAQPPHGRMYQVPLADRIRNEAGIATMAVGNIYEADHVNTIIAAGRADLCAIGRPHLIDAAWTLRAAAQLGHEPATIPNPYRAGWQQLQRQYTRPD